MKPPPIPSDAAPIAIVSDRVFMFAALTTLLVALAIGSAMGFLAFGAMRELAITRDALESERARAVSCETARNRLDAKLEQVGELLDYASGRKKAVGGP